MAEATLAITLGEIESAPTTLTVDRDELRARGRAIVAPPSESSEEVVSCGAPIAGHEVAVLDAAGRPLSDGCEGEIAVRGPSITPGYFDDDRETAAVYRDGWLHTGDLGFVSGGQLYVTGRAKDLIIIAGRNFHPQSIEWCAEDDPAFGAETSSRSPPSGRTRRRRLQYSWPRRRQPRAPASSPDVSRDGSAGNWESSSTRSSS
jgi:fatty-acyl-CoA synthase